MNRPEIAVQNPNRYADVATSAHRLWLAELISALAPETDSLAVRFCGDRAMRGLNRSYRGIDRTTDVLSFPGERTPEGRHLGDVVISVPQARRQAEAKAHDLDRELKILTLHGVLHCLGHDHERDRGQMTRVERRLRRRWI